MISLKIFVLVLAAATSVQAKSKSKFKFEESSSKLKKFQKKSPSKLKKINKKNPSSAAVEFKEWAPKATTKAMKQCKAINANDFSSWKKMSAAGWVNPIDKAVTHHHVGVGSSTNHGEVCNTGEKNWWGWKTGAKVGEISITAPISGEAMFDVGNCWNAGVVKVYANGKQILAAQVGQGSKKIVFKVKAGQTVSIRDEGKNSVMRLNEVKFFGCMHPGKVKDIKAAIAKENSPFTQCKAINTNDFSSWSKMSAVGWVNPIDKAVTHHHVGVGSSKTNGAVCNSGKNNWWGWQSGAKVGEISIKAPMSGEATIDVGNCWNAGIVKVYANGALVLAAQVGEGSMKAKFLIKAGQTISIRDEGKNSVMRLNSLQFACNEDETMKKEMMKKTMMKKTMMKKKPDMEVAHLFEADCDHTQCEQWDCSQWCACYEEASVPIYEKYNCMDDDEPCVCSEPASKKKPYVQTALKATKKKPQEFQKKEVAFKKKKPVKKEVAFKKKKNPVVQVVEHDVFEQLKCEHDTLALKCNSGKVIKILKASYGRTAGKETCPHAAVSNQKCHAKTSVAVVSKACNGKKSCKVQAKNHVFGDPCGGTYKYLTAKYTCVHM